MLGGEKRMMQQDVSDRFYRDIWPLRAKVLRTARYLAPSYADAEDLAQQTLMKAFKGMEGFRGGSDAQRWLMAILRNTWIDQFRGHAKPASLEAEEIDVADSRPPVSEGVKNPQASFESLSDNTLAEAVKELPEAIRWTVLLLYVEQMDEGTVAKVLEVPVGTIKSRAWRGRAMLREILAAKGYGADQAGNKRFNAKGIS